MREQTVSSGFMLGLLDYAVTRGADRAALLAQTGVDADALADHDARIPFTQYIALMHAAKAGTGDPALALNFGQAVNVADLSVAGLVSQACETMLEAFEQLNRYVRLIVDIDLVGDDRFVLQRDALGLWFADLRSDANAFPELTESAFSHIIAGPRRAGVPDWVREVRVTHAKPAYAAEYERIFRAPIMFNADRNALRMDESVVTHKVGLLPRYVFGILAERADALMRDLEASTTTRGRVERTLMPILHTGEISMDAVAAHLGLGRQSLYRNLKSEDVTFEQVLDELRHRLALDYLRTRRASVTDTAYLVGFSDPAAFSRAFKRWTGMSPRDARK